MFSEQQAKAIPQQETPSEWAEVTSKITDISTQIKTLCEKNDLAKKLFEFADTWGAPIKRLVELFQDILKNNRYEHTLKQKLSTEMVVCMQNFLHELQKQTNQGNHAQALPIKKAKEALSHLFTIN